jgi:hypothetical protein
MRPKRSPRLGKDRNGTITRGCLRLADRPQRKNEKSRPLSQPVQALFNAT